MGLLSLFQRQTGVSPAAAGGNAAQVVAAARTRAKRRLIGAVLLLGIGVIAFPLLFETQPRPIPVDIPIEIPRKEGAPPLVMPPARPAAAAAVSKPPPAPPLVPESRTDAGKVVAAPAPVAVRTEPAAQAVDPKVEAKPAPKSEPKPAAEAPGRFVVQIGAFADANGARETRAKVEKLGLRTYTQAVDTDSGKRIRVRLGPFVTRDEADQAAAKLKAAGLPAAVLTL